MRLGITGSSRSYTPWQEAKLRELMTSFRFTEFHHGDCVNVDALGHRIALEIREQASSHDRPIIHIHPPDKDSKRAFCQGGDVVWPPKPYLERDEDIALCEVLIVLPEGPEEKFPRSGTWATVRRARKNKYVLIIRLEPDEVIRFG